MFRKVRNRKAKNLGFSAQQLVWTYLDGLITSMNPRLLVVESTKLIVYIVFYLVFFPKLSQTRFALLIFTFLINVLPLTY